MTTKNWRNIAYILAMIGSIQSLVFSTIAMFFYTGGNISNPSSPGYSFFENILSDLGRLYAYSGQSNLISCVIYNISLFFMGALLIPYFLAVPNLFRGLKESRWFCIAGSVAGLFLSIMLIGASVTPADLLMNIHLTFGMFAFFIGLPLTILFSVAIIINKEYPNTYAIIYALLGVVLFIFIIMMFLDVDSPIITPRFAIGQKVVIYTMLACFFFQAYGARRLKINSANKS